MEKQIKFFWVVGFFLPAINATVFNKRMKTYVKKCIIEAIAIKKIE